MKIFTAVAIVQALLIVADAICIPPDDAKEVSCFYINPLSLNLNGTFEIEDIDATLCDNLLVDETAMEETIVEHYDRKHYQESNRTGMLEKFQRLKEANPNLKLIAQIPFYSLGLINHIWDRPQSSNDTVENSVRLLEEMGFDGLDFNLDRFSTEKLGQLTEDICELKNEFDKRGYMITTTLTGRLFTVSPVVESTFNYGKLSNCCDLMHILSINQPSNVTQRLYSLSKMKSTMDKYIDRGVPPNKIVAFVPGFGSIYHLADLQDTGLGAKVDKSHQKITSTKKSKDLARGYIFYRDLLNDIKNTSYNWTVIRDEETKEPYAFTSNGLWAAYDDRASMEVKAKYVLERGLRGMGIYPINTEDVEGVAGEGRFLLTRAAHDSLKRCLDTLDIIS